MKYWLILIIYSTLKLFVECLDYEEYLKRRYTKKWFLTKETLRPFLNNIVTNLSHIQFNCSRTNKNGKHANFKIASWNVAGLRAAVKKKGMDYIHRENADIVFLQEVKCAEYQLPAEVEMKGYHRYWCLGLKKGYAGVGLYSKVEPIDVMYGLGHSEFDEEGRVITAEYNNFYVVGIYAMNSGTNLRNLPKREEWDETLREYLITLDKKKPVILIGDLNVSHNPIDLARPSENEKNAGFTIEERTAFSKLLDEGFVDTFRHLYPNVTGAYTFWTYAGKARIYNIGWRLDYYVLSERLMDHVCDSVIRKEVYGSDHCPVVLHLNV